MSADIQKDSDFLMSARLSFNSPMLPYFLAIFIAFLVAGAFENLRALWSATLSVGLFFLLFETTARFAYGLVFNGIFTSKKFDYSLFAIRLFGVFFLSVWYFYFRVGANPYVDFPASEVTITARVDQVSIGANDSRYGVATILSTPDFLKGAEGFKVWFTISDGKNRTTPNKNIKVSQEVKIKGVFASLYPSQVMSRGHYSAKPESRDFEKYLRKQFIYFKIFARIADVEIIAPANVIYSFFGSVRDYMDKSLSGFFSEEKVHSSAAKAYRAMILGDKSLLTKTQKQSYIDTGTMHIFSISGLHIGFAAASVFFVLFAFGASWRVSAFVALPILCVYVYACGAPPSALRAFGMIAFFWLALAFSRGVRPLSALILSATVTLIVSPSEIFNAGFALSYSIVAAIFVYAMPLYDYLRRLVFRKIEDDEMSVARRFLRWLGAYLLVSFCISLGALFVGASLSAYYFHYISPMAIFYSPFFVSGAGVAVMFGFVGFALPEFLSKFLNEFSVFIVGFISDFAVEGTRIWNGRIDINLPSIFLAYLATFGFLMLSAIFAKRRSVVKRFVFAPAFVVSIMLIGLMKKWLEI